MKAVLFALSILLLSTVSAGALVPSDAGSASFSVTDFNGKTVAFDGPVEHIVVFGYAAAVTIAETGNVSKIVGADQYSQYDYYKDERLKDLSAYNLGNPYAADFSAVTTWLYKQVEDGNFDKENDAVIITSSTKANTVLRPELEENGFKRVLFWGTMYDYSVMVDCVDSIAKIAGGTNNPVSKQARQLYEEALGKTASMTSKVPYIYVWKDSSKGIGIGNDNSIGSSMIICAGGENMAPKDMEYTSGGFYFGGDDYFVRLVEKHPEAVIAVAYNFNMTAQEFADAYMGGKNADKVLVMEKNWNNYCLDSIKGLAPVHRFLAKDPFTVTDLNGNTFQFDGPVDHLVTFGYAATLTVAETGNISKIIGADQYSQYDYYKDERLKDLSAYNFGNPYASDFSGLTTWLYKQVEDGYFDKENDAVIITSSSKANTVLRPELEENGFKKVLFWGTLNNYSEMIQCVDDIAKIAGGTDNPVSKQAWQIYHDTVDKASQMEKKVPFIYLRYSSTSGIGIGDNSSLGSALIICAGGENVAPSDVEYSGGIYYGGDDYFVKLFEKNPDAIVMVSYNFKMTAQEFSDRYLDGKYVDRVYVMDSNSTNYCLDSVKQLPIVHEVLKNSVKKDDKPVDDNPEGQTPTDDEPESDSGGKKSGGIDSTVLIAAVAAAVLAVAAALAYVKLRK